MASQADSQDKVRSQDLKTLQEVCGTQLRDLSKSEIESRLVLVGMLVDLMVYDLTMEQGGVSQSDFEECIAEFMLNFYNVQDDMDSIEDIAKILLTVRTQLSETATMEQVLWSEQFERLKVINDGMVQHDDKVKKFSKQLADSSDEEEGDEEEEEAPELVEAK